MTTRYTDDPLEIDWESEGQYSPEEYIPPEPPIRNVTNMEQYRGQPNTVFIDERGGDESASRKIREYGPNGEILSEEQMPKKSSERIPSKPKDQDLDIFSKFKDFEKQWLPQAQAEAEKRGEQAAQEYINANWNIKEMSEKSLSFGDERARIQANAKLIKNKTMNKHIDDLRKTYTPLFKEAYAKELQQKAKEETVRQEAIRDKREKEQEQERYIRNEADKATKRAEDAATKKEADRIKAEEKKLTDAEKKEERQRIKFTELNALRKAVAEATTDENGKPKEPNPDIIEPLLDMADKAGYELKKVTGKPVERGIPGIGYKQFFGEKEPDKWTLVQKQKPTGLKQIGTSGGKPVYDFGNGKWQVGK